MSDAARICSNHVLDPEKTGNSYANVLTARSGVGSIDPGSGSHSFKTAGSSVTIKREARLDGICRIQAQNLRRSTPRNGTAAFHSDRYPRALHL